MKTLKAALCLFLIVLMTFGSLCASAETLYLAKTKKNVTVYSKSKAVDTLAKGTYVICKAASNDAVYVLARNGVRGYVSPQVLSVKSSIDSSAIGTVKKKTTLYGIKHGQPYVINSVSKGTPVIVKGVYSGYAKVRTILGDTGYIKASLIK